MEKGEKTRFADTYGWEDLKNRSVSSNSSNSNSSYDKEDNTKEKGEFPS